VRTSEDNGRQDLSEEEDKCNRNKCTRQRAPDFVHEYGQTLLCYGVEDEQGDQQVVSVGQQGFDLAGLHLLDLLSTLVDDFD